MNERFLTVCMYRMYVRIVRAVSFVLGHRKWNWSTIVFRFIRCHNEEKKKKFDQSQTPIFCDINDDVHSMLR